MKKIYLIDTNVILEDPNCIFKFPESIVVLHIIVLEELDKFKSDLTELGVNSRTIIRKLDELLSFGNFINGIKLENGSILKIILEEDRFVNFTNNDNKIIYSGISLKNQGFDVTFVSQDINARVKANAMGLNSTAYSKEDKISIEEIYLGWVSLKVPAVKLKKDNLCSSELKDLYKKNKLYPNQFVVLESQNNPENKIIFRHISHGTFKKVEVQKLKWQLEPKNIQQIMALDLLFDDSINLISLIGPAGTGKTFLALLAGLHKTLLTQTYDKILISRPVIPLGRDIGYLPGTVEEKLQSWMQPIYDNLELINHHVSEDKKFKKIFSIDSLVRDKKLSLDAITYMRGRSIAYQFILIDEVQNLTAHEVKTLISRVGKNSKMILCGDPYQIDAPYLDFYNNGLMVTTNKFLGQELFGAVYLSETERSELSRIASQIL